MLIHPDDLGYLKRKYPRYTDAEIIGTFNECAKQIAYLIERNHRYLDPPAPVYTAALMKTHCKLEVPKKRERWARAYFQLLDHYSSY